MELYKLYRPKSFDEMEGQKGVSVLQNYLDKGNLPQALLFTGASGCGKTTAARIIAWELEADTIEMNCSDFRGIDTVREIRNKLQYHSLYAENRIFIIDESHKLTNDAMNALLKPLEDTPKGNYFILCTTEPNKLIKAIKTRCTSIQFNLCTPLNIQNIIQDVMDKAKINLHEDVLDSIVDAAEGSPRRALVLLDNVKDIEDEEEAVETIQNNVITDDDKEVIELCRLLFSEKCNWSGLMDWIRTAKVDEETVRRTILSYSNTILSKQNSPTTKKSWMCRAVIEEMSEPFFNTGKAGLTAAFANILAPPSD